MRVVCIVLVLYWSCSYNVVSGR